MTVANGKKIICIDCPLDANDNGISKFMSNRRNQSDGLYSKLAEKGYLLVPFLNPHLEELQTALADPSVAFLTASGHGTDDGNSFVREWNDDLLVAGGLYDRKAFDRKIVHLFACATAENLGPDMVGPDIHDGTGLKAFIGYNAAFSFAANYQQDQNAAQMLVDCDSAIDLALADGQTPDQALACAANAFNALINEWQFDRSKKTLVDLVRQDRDALCLLPGLYNPA
jgi:hypothetical protein